MTEHRLPRRAALSAAVLSALMIVGCATQAPPPPAPAPVTRLPTPPAIKPQDLVGRWGYASYHRLQDQKRTERAARRQCRKPHIIRRGPTGGVIMHVADQAKPEELEIKGGQNGNTYIGPGPRPGGPQDRKVVSFDGRVLVLHWLDPSLDARYGNGVYVRCPPRA